MQNNQTFEKIIRTKPGNMVKTSYKAMKPCKTWKDARKQENRSKAV